MNTKIDTDIDSPTFGQRLVYDEHDALIGTWDVYLAKQAEPSEDFDIVLEEVLPSAPPTPAPTPKLDAAIARHVKKHRVTTTRQLLDKPEPPWFIDQLVPQSARLVLHGDPGSKKTFLALDWAVCAQHNLPWHGKAIEPGSVFYVLGEGTAFLAKRLKALAFSKDMDPRDIKITWMEEPLNLYTATDAEVSLWAGFVRHFDFKYLFFDTLSMNTAGMEENSAKEMEAAIARATKIAGGASSGRTVVLVHHNTKKGDMRGSSALLGNCDTILELKETGPLESTLKSDKIRDAESFSNMALTFAEHEESDSIYISTVGSATPATTNESRILNILRAEPDKHTKNAVCCMIGDSGAVQRAFNKMHDEAWIVPKDIPKGKGVTTVWHVDEDELPFVMQ